VKSHSKYDHFSRRYSDTKVVKSAILLLKNSKNGRKWPIFRNLSPDIFARNCSIWKQTSVLRLFQCRLSNKCIKLPIANSSFFGAKFVTSYSRQKVAIPEKTHTFCKNDMFYVHGKFCRNRMKIKEVEARWRFGMHFCQA
jgi:hypothetical protein